MFCGLFVSLSCHVERVQLARRLREQTLERNAARTLRMVEPQCNTVRHPHPELKGLALHGHTHGVVRNKRREPPFTFGKRFAKQTLQRKRTLGPREEDSERRLSTHHRAAAKHINERMDKVQLPETSVHLRHPRRQSGDFGLEGKPVAPRFELGATPIMMVENCESTRLDLVGKTSGTSPRAMWLRRVCRNARDERTDGLV